MPSCRDQIFDTEFFPFYFKTQTIYICCQQTSDQSMIYSCSAFLCAASYACLSCICLSGWLTVYILPSLFVIYSFYKSRSFVWSAWNTFNFYHNIKSKIWLLSYKHTMRTFNSIVWICAHRVDRFCFEFSEKSFCGFLYSHRGKELWTLEVSKISSITLKIEPLLKSSVRKNPAINAIYPIACWLYKCSCFYYKLCSYWAWARSLNSRMTIHLRATRC